MYVVAYIVCSPYIVAVAPLVAEVAPVGPRASDVSLADYMEEVGGARLKCNFGHLMSAADIGDVPEPRLRWLPNLEYQGGTSLSTRSGSWAWQDYVDQLPETVTKRKAGAADGTDAHDEGLDDIVQEYPWLA